MRINHLTLAGLLLSFIFSLQVHAAEMKEWNMLVFLNGVNDLDSFGEMNLNQMEEVGSTSKLNILVQWGSYAKPNVERLLIRKDNNKNRVTSPVIQSRGAADMGDWNELVNFVTWAQKNYPAKKTFVVVWNHGSGWHRIEGIETKDISYDERTGNKITTEQLGMAMKKIAQVSGKPVDLYGSDACLMGMIEVADEMAGAVKIFVGSQDLEPGEGWPYSTFLKAWTSNMKRTPAQVGVLLSKEFLKSYSSGGLYGKNSVTMSVFDMAYIGHYRSAASRLGQQLADLPSADLVTLRAAANATKSFNDPDYRDLIDFVNISESKNVRVPAAAQLRTAHKKFVITNDQNQDKKTHGLSIWLPTNTAMYDVYRPRYEGLSFERNTNWSGFLEKMVSAR